MARTTHVKGSKREHTVLSPSCSINQPKHKEFEENESTKEGPFFFFFFRGGYVLHAVPVA